MLKDVACKPSYIKLRNHPNYPPCGAKEDLDHFYRLVHKAAVRDNQRPPPCREMEKMTFAFDEYDWLADKWIVDNGDEAKQNATKEVFEILFEFPDATYLEIEQTMAYDTQTLIGNIGAYIGMFLGFR